MKTLKGYIFLYISVCTSHGLTLYTFSTDVFNLLLSNNFTIKYQHQLLDMEEFNCMTSNNKKYWQNIILQKSDEPILSVMHHPAVRMNPISNFISLHPNLVEGLNRSWIIRSDVYFNKWVYIDVEFTTKHRRNMHHRDAPFNYPLLHNLKSKRRNYRRDRNIRIDGVLFNRPYLRIEDINYKEAPHRKSTLWNEVFNARRESA